MELFILLSREKKNLENFKLFCEDKSKQNRPEF